MHIGNMKLWLGLGVVGMVAAIVVLFGTSLNNTPNAEATTGGFDSIEIQVGKPDNDPKVATATFTCLDAGGNSVGDPVDGVRIDHLKDVNPNGPPELLHHEVWRADFPAKCTDSVKIQLTRDTGPGDLTIKGCLLENKTSGKKALCDLTPGPTSTNDEWNAAIADKGSKFNRIVVEIDQGLAKEFKIEKDNPLNTFTCESTVPPETVPAEYKDLKLADNKHLFDYEVWSGTFTKICEVTDNGGGDSITISLVPVIATNTINISSCHLQYESDLGGAQKKAECIPKPATPVGAAQVWDAFYVANVNDGNLAGVTDILVGDLNAQLGLFYCIVKTDHDTSDNAITTYLQCNIDIEGAGVDPLAEVLTPPTWGDTCEALAARTEPECAGVDSETGEPFDGDCQGPGPCILINPSQTGADVLPGPPPPPPYTSLVPQIGRGFYYPGGVGEPGDVCGTTDCTVVTSCFEDVGPVAGTGPNIISTAVLLNPKVDNSVMVDTTGDTTKDTKVDRVSSGTVNIWYNQTNTACKALEAKGEPTILDLPLQSIQVNDKGGTNVNPNPVPWRPSSHPGATVLDFDGDGCTDEQELDPNIFEKCGDDPQNPSDSFGAGQDLSGVYDILVRVIRGDCVNPCELVTDQQAGIYFFCRADIQHNTSTNDLVLRPYCYTDTAFSEINPEAFPGIFGDGMAGAPPPGPQASCSGDDPRTCTRTASGLFAYGDIDEAHDELLGFYDKNRNLIVVGGCFQDLDGQGSIGNVYVELTVSAHQRPGKVDIWILQDQATCVAGAAFGTYPGDPTFG
ncbi:MAG: hypothetical protein IIC91_07310, partial [Chloroflexi bacterium]|nr:hypothetical protein [Chloroflexota bacterium]